MSAINALAWCLGLAFFSLVLVSYVNARQARRRLMSRKIDSMKRRIVELEEITALIEPLLENIAIVRTIIKDLIEIIQQTYELDPSSHYLDASLSAARERLRSLQGTENPLGLWRVLSSDAAIARARYALNECGRVIRKQQHRGELTTAEMELYINELAWAHLMVGVVTLVAQGHQSITRGDTLKGFAYYKNAQHILMQSPHPDERKHQFIKELSEIQHNQRRSISTSLMPETDYNPGEIPKVQQG